MLMGVHGATVPEVSLHAAPTIARPQTHPSLMAPTWSQDGPRQTGSPVWGRGAGATPLSATVGHDPEPATAPSHTGSLASPASILSVCGGSLLFLIGWALRSAGAPSAQPAPDDEGTGTARPRSDWRLSRRDILGYGSLLSVATAANAFDNALPEAAQYPGPKRGKSRPPPGLGLAQRAEDDVLPDGLGDGPSLKVCGNGPNCFSTTGDPDLDYWHMIPRWQPPEGVSPEAALAQVKDVVRKYPPGQQGIDGGGFRIASDKPNYLWVEFESLKNGYIDDVEFALPEVGSGLLVRSSSRLGYYDFRVNAKRLNWFAGQLTDLGWSAPQVTPETNPDYFAENNR